MDELIEIPKGKKIIIFKEKGRVKIEIKRHKDPIMDNILIVNSIGSKTYEDNWIIEKDLPTWIQSFKAKGLNQINIVDDVGSNKENNKKTK